MENNPDRSANVVLGVALCLGVLGAAFGAAHVTGAALSPLLDAQVTAKIEAQAAERKSDIRPGCDATVAQFGPGERWVTHHHVYECVRFARAVPNSVLTSPIARTE